MIRRPAGHLNQTYGSCKPARARQTLPTARYDQGLAMRLANQVVHAGISADQRNSQIFERLGQILLITTTHEGPSEPPLPQRD